MKRLLILIFITAICITGFFISGALPSDQGIQPVLSVLFDSSFSRIILLIFIILLAAILYRHETRNIIQALYLKMITKPVFYEPNAEPVLVSRIESAEQRMANTEEALNKFSQAIEKYALHLSSHTGAIRGLNAASHELQRGAATQNRVLMHLMQNMDRPVNSSRTPHWRIDPPTLVPGKTESSRGEKRSVTYHEIPDADRVSIPPGCARKPRRKTEKPVIDEPDTSSDEVSTEPSPELAVDTESLRDVQQTIREIRARQGKSQLQRSRAEEALAAEEEILKAIRKLNAQLDKSEFQE